MIIKTKGIELTEPKSFVNQAGEYTLKITGVVPDGFTDEGNEKFKMNFISGSGEIHSERFSLNDNMLWKIANVAKACGAPVGENNQLQVDVDIDFMIGMYVKVVFKERIHQGKTYVDAREWNEAPQNKKVLETKKWIITQDDVTDEEIEMAF